MSTLLSFYLALFMMKNLMWHTLLMQQCEKLYLAIERVPDTCAITIGETTNSGYFLPFFIYIIEHLYFHNYTGAGFHSNHASLYWPSVRLVVRRWGHDSLLRLLKISYNYRWPRILASPEETPGATDVTRRSLATVGARLRAASSG